MPSLSQVSGALLIWALATGGSTQRARLTQTQATARARQLVSRMTIEEKIIELHGIQDADHYRFVPGLERLGIPSLRVTNGPAGVGPGAAGSQKLATALPAPIALAASWDPELARTYGRIAAEETRALENNLLESPDINIARVPQGGRVFEGYGEDPYLVSRIAVAHIEGIQGTGVIANVKHFLANNQEAGRHIVDEQISERTLREIYMPAFEASVREAHVASLMCAYPKVNGKYNCENGPLLNDVLKKEWRFDGFVTSDFGAVHSTLPSVGAGLDLELPTGIYYGDALHKAGEPGAVIDAMLVRRFTKMLELGWFSPQPKLVPIPILKHGKAARDIATQSMVLLKNNGNMLPLDSNTVKSVALLGPFAVRAIAGGGGSSRVIPLYSIAPYDGLNAALLSQTRITLLDGCDIAAASEAAREAEVAIVMVGDEETEGQDHSIELPSAQNQLIEAVAKANLKTIVVLKSGSAVLMPWISDVAAVLEAWYPGEEDGNAIADVLLGKVNPSGKLPLTFPQSVNQTLAVSPEQYPGVNGLVRYSEGLEVGYRFYSAHAVSPLFPFGYGLSYTQFRFDDLKTSCPSPGGHSTVSFRVTNVGDRTGAEVAQLYLAFPPISEGNEPPIQLKGFRKVLLEPGEAAEVELRLDSRAFSFWSQRTHTWQLASGVFQVLVGNSSTNISLKADLTIP